MSEPERSRFNPGTVQHGLRRSQAAANLGVPELIAELDALVADQDRDIGKTHARLLGMLGARINNCLDTPPNRFSRAKAGILARLIAQHPRLDLPALANGTFVDLGCGGLNPLSSLIVLVAAGAGRAIGIDLDELNESLALPALARTALELIGDPSLYLPATFPAELLKGERVRARLSGLKIRQLVAGRREALVGAPIEYRRCPAEETGLASGSVACVSSDSFLEHVPDADAAVAEMARISAPGAIGLHVIDTVDHRSYGNSAAPLDFLAEDSEAPIVFGSNRIRPHAFCELFERHGFEICERVDLRSVKVTAEQREQFAEPFRGMALEQLEPVCIRLDVRKP